MRENDPPPPGPAADTGGEKKASNDDERKPRGRRSRQRANKQRHRDAAAVAPAHIPKDKFVGRSDDLKGFIYDVTNIKGGVVYARTTDEIARYVGEKYTTTGSFIRTAILTLSVPDQPRPTAPTGIGNPPVVDSVDQEIFREEVRMFVKTKAAITSTMKSLYDLIWGQCSDSLRSRLRGNSDFVTYSAAANSLALLMAIRAEMTGFRTKQYLPSHSRQTSQQPRVLG
jgi:hypothetical protein